MIAGFIWSRRKIPPGGDAIPLAPVNTDCGRKANKSTDLRWACEALLPCSRNLVI